MADFRVDGQYDDWHRRLKWSHDDVDTNPELGTADNHWCVCGHTQGLHPEDGRCRWCMCRHFVWWNPTTPRGPREEPYDAQDREVTH